MSIVELIGLSFGLSTAFGLLIGRCISFGAQ